MGGGEVETRSSSYHVIRWDKFACIDGRLLSYDHTHKHADVCMYTLRDCGNLAEGQVSAGEQVGEAGRR